MTKIEQYDRSSRYPRGTMVLHAGRAYVATRDARPGEAPTGAPAAWRPADSAAAARNLSGAMGSERL